MPTVLLIGASRGIGFELARQYLDHGARVMATARSDAGLDRLKALGAQALRLDVANPASNSGLAW
ncbi:MAG: SDR family NAD(P)-dependent oxidoreductase, partial [Betaproteobacteria bacterium]|nr:SDR family NAD(P)-dependent oxidoreductase [Betaproteobacteria bacterium]